MELYDLLREASKHGAAWPPEVRSAAEMVAECCGLLALVKSRGERLPVVEGSLRSIREPLSAVDGIQSMVWRHEGLRDEIIQTSARFNTVALWLSSQARAVARSTPGQTVQQVDDGARTQFQAWWLQLGMSLYDYNRETAPMALVEQMPVVLAEVVRQMQQALAVPVIQLPPGTTVGGGVLTGQTQQPGILQRTGQALVGSAGNIASGNPTVGNTVGEVAGGALGGILGGVYGGPAGAARGAALGGLAGGVVGGAAQTGLEATGVVSTGGPPPPKVP